MAFILYIDHGAGALSFAVDLRADATLSDLYGAVQGELGHIDFRLRFGSALLQQFEEDGSRPTTALAELGVGAESAIHCNEYMLQDWEHILRTFEPILMDKDSVRWYQDAAKCRGNPESAECTDEAICSNPNWWWITCDDTYHVTAINAHGPAAGIDLFHLNGVLSLKWMPPKLKNMDLRGHSINNVLLGELSGEKALKHLYLAMNQINGINLSDLRGSNLKILDLSDNQILKVDFHGLIGTSLKTLDLEHNQITEITFRGLINSQLRRLNVQRNPFRKIDFRDIHKTPLQELKCIREDDMEDGTWQNVIYRSSKRHVTYLGHLRKAYLGGLNQGESRYQIDMLFNHRIQFQYAPLWTLSILTTILLASVGTISSDMVFGLGGISTVLFVFIGFIE